MNKKRDWNKIIAYCQAIGAVMGIYSGLNSLALFFEEIGSTELILALVILIIFIFGLIAAIMIIKEKSSGIALSTLFWSLQIPYFSVSSISYKFYCFLYLVPGVNLTTNGLFTEFGIMSGFQLYFGSGINMDEYLAINLAPFIIFLVWAQLGKYDRKTE